MDKILSSTVDADYMSIGYDYIEEPLNLKDIGQKWFCDLLDEYGRNRGEGLVLGSVAWMANNLIKKYRRVFVIDKSEAALDRLLRLREESNFNAICRLNSDWRYIDSDVRELSLVTADNSLAYFNFPEGWSEILEVLHKRMCVGGTVIFRTFSVPAHHKPQTTIDIINRSLSDMSLTATGVRTLLLFSSWNPVSYEIQTEDALYEYEKHIEMFPERFNCTEVATREICNDLQAIIKYRNQKIVYYAPPLRKILPVIEERFEVLDVRYGEYLLADYFPAVIAKKR